MSVLSHKQSKNKAKQSSILFTVEIQISCHYVPMSCRSRADLGKKAHP